MTGLLSLPTELLQAVGSDLSSWKRLRLVCLQLSAAMDPLVLSHIVINVTRPRLSTSVSQLQSLSCNESHVAHFVRELSIRSLAPGRGTRPAEAQMMFADGVWVPAQTRDNMEMAAPQDGMEEYLETAISNMENLQVVRWTTTTEDPKWTQCAVINGLTQLRSLNYLNLHLSFGFDASGLRLDRLAGLKRVAVSGSCPSFHEHIVRRLGACIAQSPDMNSINIDRSHWNDDPDIPTLHSLLRNAPLIRLKHLGLKSWYTCLDAITLPHLRFLTSLTLINNYSPPYDGHSYSSTTEDIWSALCKCKIYLEVISTDSMGPSLIEYLSSYSGLMRLYLKNIAPLDQQSSNQLADMFYFSALGQHVATIEDLYVLPCYEGKWCFGAHIVSVVAQCSKLQYAKFAVIASEITSSDKQHQDVIGLLISTAAHYWRSLKTLSISTAKPESLRSHEHYHALKKHFTFAADQVVRRITNFIPEPEYQAFLPTITADSIKYIPQQLDGCDVDDTRPKLRYCRRQD